MIFLNMKMYVPKILFVYLSVSLLIGRVEIKVGRFGCWHLGGDWFDIQPKQRHNLLPTKYWTYCCNARRAT